MKDPKQKVYASYYPLKSLTIIDLGAMHDLFIDYYHNVDFAVFYQDLSKKDGAILLRERRSKKIVGFSTLQLIPLECGSRKVKGVFSGDTIVDRRYWGNRALLSCFVRTLFKFKIKDIRTPLYWLLISKGYKTYLVLANNFPKHYPHHAKSSSSRMATVIDNYCQTLYPDAYDRSRQLLDFGEGYQKLKEDVAGITDKMKSENPKIRYFEEKNPTWRDGTELPCVGEVSYSVFLVVLKKITREFLARFKTRNAVRASL
ncbi:hypothetical protein OLMES_3377 [Oleiphilus messinensis]|uniref:Uncharacterized protein n=1 Tax=Oleiphilus messinensis TaxID=141451 RepID=A0A1Y0ID65_9GAMM|nr:hypothetical protein [Oleiphilus messinensis]ARU57415.1 hypothetical protein OLMES_3377 [Oleiphilus messinensis]